MCAINFCSVFCMTILPQLYISADAIPTSSQIRVCPSIQDRKGWLWSKNSYDKANWMIDVEFSISGKHSFGADGMVNILPFLPAVLYSRINIPHLVLLLNNNVVNNCCGHHLV